MGGRRVYVQGHHSECAYLICYVVVDKRSEEDRAEDPRLKARIFRALVEPPTRTLVGPAPEAALPSVTLPRELVERAFGQGDSAARQHLVQAAWQAVVTTYQASGRPVPEAATLTREVGLLVSQAETEYWIQRGQR